MTLTAAQYRTVTHPDKWVRIICDCDQGWLLRGVQYPTRCRTCAGEGHVYVLKARVWSHV